MPAEPPKQTAPSLLSTNMIWRQDNSQLLRKAQTTQRFGLATLQPFPEADIRPGVSYLETAGATPREARTATEVPQLSSRRFKPGDSTRCKACSPSAAIIAGPCTSAGCLPVPPCVAKSTRSSSTAARHQLFDSKQPSIGAWHTIEQAAQERKRSSLFTRLSPPKCRRQGLHSTKEVEARRGSLEDNPHVCY